MQKLKFNKIFGQFPKSLKFSKFQNSTFITRVTPSHADLNKIYKSLEDKFKVLDFSHFNTFALMMQSDTFHEHLFESLSK